MMTGWRALGRAERRSTVEAVILACLLEVRLRRRGLRDTARWCGVSLKADGSDEVGVTEGAIELTPVERLRVRAVRRVMRHWRFAAGPCLREALLTGRALRRLRPELVIGVASDEHGVRAHAWLDVAGRAVGGRDDYLQLRGPGGRAGTACDERRPTDVAS